MKRWLWVLLAAVAFALFFIILPDEGRIVYASGEKAEQVPLAVSSDRPADGNLSNILDDSAYTRFVSDKENRLTFSASSPFRRLYFLFDKPCAWTLVLPGGKVLPGGRDGFLDEFFDLTEAADRFDMIIPEGCRLTEVYAFSEGELPDWVHIWQPPCEKADLLLLPTHADDEHLWFGGAMPYYAGELGYRVQVVYMTYHASQPWRFHELLNGLWTVGVRNYPVFVDKFRDTVAAKPGLYAAESIYGRDKVVEFQVETLRRFAPRVILAHDINGEYGHGAHRLNASTLLEALKIYENPSVYPESAEKYGITPVQKCYLHLWRENPITVSWSDKLLSRFGGRSAYEMAVEGYHCHKSQLIWSNYVLERGSYDCRKFGLAYTTVGPDTPGQNDLFEHVTLWELPVEEDDTTEEAAVPEETVPEETAAAESPRVDPIVIEPMIFTDPSMCLYGVKMHISDLMVFLAASMFLAASLVFTVCVKIRERIQRNRRMKKAGNTPKEA